VSIFFEEVWNDLVPICCVRQDTLNSIQTQTFYSAVLFQCMLLFQKLTLSKTNLSTLDNVQEVLISECLSVNDSTF